MPIKFDSALPKHELSILAGASGAGKSTLVIQAIGAWSQGLPFLDIHPTRPIRFGYIAADRGYASLLEHAARGKVNIDSIPIVSLVDDLDLDLAKLQTHPLKVLCELLDSLRNKGAELIIVDPIMIFLGSDLNRYHLVAPPLIQLNRYCKANSLTILGIHHTTKARSDFAFLRPQDRISGSSALSAFTSTQWALWSAEELPDAQREEGLSRLDIISHTAPAETIWMHREGGLFSVAAPKMDELGSVPQLILSVLSESPLPAGSIVQTLAAEASRASVYRALDLLVAKGLVSRPDRGMYQKVGA